MNRLFFILLLFQVACLGPGNREEDPVVAKVFDDYLYRSDLDEIVPVGLDLEDSLLVVKDHVDKWIRNRLLLNQAKENLSPEAQNVERQIEDYRTSLLIFKYEQSYISHKLDTLITDAEVTEYYNSYSSNFILSNHLLRGIFLKVPRSAPQTWQARNWVRSGEAEQIKQLEEYAFNNATIFDYFDEDWRYLSDILAKMPQIYLSPENLLSRSFYEVSDTTYRYYLKISDSRLEGSVKPLELVREDIRSILLNKRKIQLIQELESNIYNDALNRGNFTIYE